MFSVRSVISLFIITGSFFALFADISPDAVFYSGSGAGSFNCDQSVVVFAQSGYIKYVDMSSPSVAVTVGSGSDPAVDLPYIVWEQKVGSFDQIMLYNIDLDQGFQLTTGDLDHRDPTISGNRVVYRIRDAADGLFNLQATVIEWPGVGDVIDFCTAEGDQYGPSIDGDIVVWYDKRNYAVSGRDIYMYDFSDGSETALITDSGDQRYPVISGDLVVWQDDSKGMSDLDVFAYDLKEERLYDQAALGASQYYPRAGGSMFAWYDSTAGEEGIWAFDTADITMLKIASGVSIAAAACKEMICWYDGANIYSSYVPLQTPLAVIAPSGGQSYLGGTVLDVQWQNSEAQRAVDLISSFDGGGSWSVIASSLTGQSSYEWQLPETSTDEAVVGIRYSDQSGDYYGSGLFSIIDCDPLLTADISGDCFVDIKDLAILASQWMQSGLD